MTFKVEKPYPEGWFAYVSCTQPDAEFRLDMFRLYEGRLRAYEKAARDGRRRPRRWACSIRAARRRRPLCRATALAERSRLDAGAGRQTDHKFRGDAVVVNDRLAMVFRRGGPGAEVYTAAGRRAFDPAARC